MYSDIDKAVLQRFFSDPELASTIRRLLVDTVKQLPRSMDYNQPNEILGQYLKAALLEESDINSAFITMNAAIHEYPASPGNEAV